MIAKTMEKKFIKICCSIVLFCFNFSLKNSKQFSNGSKWKLFTGENTAANCSLVTVPVLSRPDSGVAGIGFSPH